MKLIKQLRSKDGITTKNIFLTDDNYLIESVYVNYYNKHIICYSTQVGCKNGCRFCYNGINNNFKRDLTFDEIITECCLTSSIISEEETFKPILFSAMGIGDPLDNYKNYIDSMYVLHESFKSSKFAMSSCVPNPEQIYDLIRDTVGINFKLQISLHSPFQDQRLKLMPCSGDIGRTFISCSRYIVMTRRDVELNVTLIDGINDSINHANELARVLKMYFKSQILDHITVKINKFNEVNGCGFIGSSKPKVDYFISELNNLGIKTEYYETNVKDINSACGQLGNI